MGYQQVINNNTQGFTLLELLIVVAVAALISTGAAFTGLSLVASTNLNTSTHNIATAIETARDYTLDHYKGNKNYGVTFSASAYSVYVGTTYTGSNTIVLSQTLPTGISLTNISFNSAAYVYFQSVSGLASNSGSVKVNSTKGNHTISVNANGIVSIQ